MRSITKAFAKSLYLSKKLLYRKPRQPLLVACMPKSGSTYLSNLLASITRSEMKMPIQGGWQNEQNLDFHRLVDSYGSMYVTQIHLAATDGNVPLIKEFGLQPIVLYRNLYDIVVSLRDHMSRESLAGFAMWADEGFFQLDESGQLDMLIDLAIPWYVKFYTSWTAADGEFGKPPYWVSYNSLTQDTSTIVSRILDYYDVHYSPTSITAAISSISGAKGTRFNKGVSGRGLEQLNEQQMLRIQKYCSYYPDVDFSRVL